MADFNAELPIVGSDVAPIEGNQDAEAQFSYTVGGASTSPALTDPSFNTGLQTP